MNIGSTVGPNPEFPLRMQPRQRPLHNPTVDPQPAAMLRTAPRQERLDPAPSQPAPLRFRVIAPVAIQAVRAAARPTRLVPEQRELLTQPPHHSGLLPLGI